MWFPFKSARIAKEIEQIAATRDFSRRIETVPGGKLGETVRHLNAILAEAEARDRELRGKLAELTDARDDAQTANQLLRRLKNDLKARSAERDAALRRAEAANEAKSQFLANVSHEVRTPLHGIIGLADVLSRTALEARQMSLVQTIIRSGRGLLGVINDVLDFSKIEAGRFDLAPRPFSLQSCIQELVAPLRPRYESKGIELVVRIDQALPDQLIGDALRIRQILSNLLENGLKFTERGLVILDVGGTQTAEMVELSICVQDTGIGIPEDKLEAVFEKFNQVDNSSTRRHQGTGLGLAICKMLAELMGGRIEAASTLGRGSTFLVRMPLPIHAVPQHLRPAAPFMSTALPPQPAVLVAEPSGNVVSLAGGAFTPVRALLAEDNAVNQEVAREFLIGMGCHVAIAHNGREAIAQFAQGGFDIVLMDCQMPEVDGLEATRAIREIEVRSGWRATPIIALTAKAYSHDRSACLAAGMNDTRSKPFSYEELESVVRKWLPERQIGSTTVLAAG